VSSTSLQLLGVYGAHLVEPLAQVLKGLGTQAAWVVHGADGQDELSLTGPSQVAQLKDGEITQFSVTPEDAGLERCDIAELKGQGAEFNAQALRELLYGKKDAYRRAVLLNAAAGLMVAGKVADLKDGVAMAGGALDEGKAYAVLNKLSEMSHAP
ncbi:MAG: anthranilate phosphoribosyltransferase, partial [Proteobacteria bacterium]|nr:anthranilate phosphoribosyltransferase [Pseudomonadota bacterium]